MQLRLHERAHLCWHNLIWKQEFHLNKSVWVNKTGQPYPKELNFAFNSLLFKNNKAACIEVDSNKCEWICPLWAENNVYNKLNWKILAQKRDYFWFFLTMLDARCVNLWNIYIYYSVSFVSFCVKVSCKAHYMAAASWELRAVNCKLWTVLTER